MDPWVIVFVAHMLTAHIAVPEPVRVEWAPELVGFEGFKYVHIAYINRPGQGTGWTMRIQEARWRHLSRYDRQWVLAHELCHAVHTYTGPSWDLLDKKAQDRLHVPVNQCANDAIRHHLMGVNH